MFDFPAQLKNVIKNVILQPLILHIIPTSTVPDFFLVLSTFHVSNSEETVLELNN